MYGLVVCGGKSTRMGMDKSMICYHSLPQWLHLKNMLLGFSKKVFISINETQKNGYQIDKDYIIDDPEFLCMGPMAAILTFFKLFPHQELLVIGCDYPLITISEIENFIGSTKRNGLASAFYNQSGFYEPLIAWYSPKCLADLKERFLKGNFSLQSFLKENNAEPYYPLNKMTMFSADTPADSKIINQIITKNNFKAS